MNRGDHSGLTRDFSSSRSRLPLRLPPPAQSGVFPTASPSVPRPPASAPSPAHPSGVVQNASWEGDHCFTCARSRRCLVSATKHPTRGRIAPPPPSPGKMVAAPVAAGGTELHSFSPPTPGSENLVLSCYPMEESAVRDETEREGGGGHVGRDVEGGAEGAGGSECGGVVVSLFNDSAEEFMSTMETVSSLCGLRDKDEVFDESEVQRWSSMVTFLKEWRYFCYEPKIVNFTYETKSPQVKEEIKGVKLPQFSSATVPEMEQSSGVRGSLYSKDFVLHAGGSVWALDWCPTSLEALDCPIKCEYLAVAAHPPDSSYHNIGTPLTGRGIVQIWCLLNTNGRHESFSERPKVRPKKIPEDRRSVRGSNVESESSLPRPRGRPRKNPSTTQSLNDANAALNSPPVRKRGRPRKLPVAPDNLTPVRKRGRPRKLPVAPENLTDNIPPPKRPRGRPRKYPEKKEKVHDMDIGKELSILNVPPLAVDDTYAENKSSPGHPSEVPGKTLDETENVDDVHAVEDLSNSKIALGDSNAKSTFVLCKRRGRPRKKPDTMEHSDVKVVEDESIVELSQSLAVNNFNLERKFPPLRQSRGRPRRRPDKLVTADDLLIVQDSSIMELAPAQSRMGSKIANVNDLHMIQELSTRTCVPAHSVNELEVQNRSPLPKRHRGRPKKGSVKALSDINGQKPKFPVHKEPAHDVDDVVASSVVKQVELRKDEHALSRMDDTVNTSCDVIQGCHMVEQILTTNSTNLCTESSSKLRVVDGKSDKQPVSSTMDIESFGSNLRPALDSSHDMEGKRLLNGNDVNLSCQMVSASPRVVLCLGHNGKVAWDVKWRPYGMRNPMSKHQMGYLAVLLGNGSLEVWDVPCPSMVTNLYKTSLKESTDPRFLKLRPVFRCSKLKFADRQSIPLTMEWSKSAPCDLILVGCHDGTVAIWKFSAEDFPQDSRPLLCFTADDAPIRAVSWAPSESGSESANLMVTAGHEGLKFWDIRDPYRPLWDLNPAQRIILSLDWLQHPSCLIYSLDDGTMRTLSLSKAACDTPVTGKSSDGSKQGVMHSYYRSQFAIWSVQVSPVTGLVAYCCADGSTLCFQLTARSVDKEKKRNKTPHFLCGVLMEIENSLTIETPLPYTSVAELTRPVRGLPPRSNNTLAEEPRVQDDDPAAKSGYGDHESSARRKKKKSGTSRSEKLLNETRRLNPSGAVGEEKQDLKTEVPRSDEKFLVFPPKMVAMHRVRWNINKGSERWLCYGGAAGIIRCQEIGLPTGF